MKAALNDKGRSARPTARLARLSLGSGLETGSLALCMLNDGRNRNGACRAFAGLLKGNGELNLDVFTMKAGRSRLPRPSTKCAKQTVEDVLRLRTALCPSIGEEVVEIARAETLRPKAGCSRSAERGGGTLVGFCIEVGILCSCAVLVIGRLLGVIAERLRKMVSS